MSDLDFKEYLLELLSDWDEWLEKEYTTLDVIEVKFVTKKEKPAALVVINDNGVTKEGWIPISLMLTNTFGEILVETWFFDNNF